MKTLIALLLTALTTNAQLVMDMVGGDLLSVGPGTAAYEFTVNAPITLRSLGVYDSDPLTPGLYNAHTVGLWDAVTHALIASAVVPAQGAVAIGSFWYVALGAPVTLTAGRPYVLGASYIDSDFEMARGNVTSVVTDPRITMRDALLSTSSGFDFPDLNVAGANYGFVGANGLETAVPEPAAVGVAAGLSLLGFAFFRRRMASVAALGLMTLSAAAEPVSIRAILDAKPAERHRLVAAMAKERPPLRRIVAPLDEPAEPNRPTTTPGNTNGRRPTVPPGRKNYGTP